MMRRGDSRDRYPRRDSRDRGRESRGRSRSNSRDRGGRDRKRHRSRSNHREKSENENKTKENVEVKVDIIPKVENPVTITTLDEEYVFNEENYRKNYKNNALEANVMNKNLILALHNINNVVLSTKVGSILTKLNVHIDTDDNDKNGNKSNDAHANENFIDVSIENEMKEDEASIKLDTSFASVDDGVANILDSIEMDKTEEAVDVGGGDDDGFDLYGDLGISESVEETEESKPAEEELKAEDEGADVKPNEVTNEDILEKKASLLTADIVSIPLYLQDMSYNRLCQVTKMNNQKGFSTTIASSMDGLKKLLRC